MRQKKSITFNILMVIAIIAVTNLAIAQDAKPRKSPKATISQRVGADTDIAIDYSRPGVKGRTVWGELVPYGLYPGNKYSKEKPFPWRAGANENTTISFNHDVKIEGKAIPAGKYGVHMIAGKSEFKIMFNKVNDAWGSYAYDAAQDALVITVKPVESAQTEWLEFGFEDLSDTGATVCLKWANLKIPFKVEL